jgi:DNA-binding beta-propeller fold protein YncE
MVGLYESCNARGRSRDGDGLLFNIRGNVAPRMRPAAVDPSGKFVYAANNEDNGASP